MAVTLTRVYGNYVSGDTLILPDATEVSLIAQGIAVAAVGFPTQSWNTLSGQYNKATIGQNVTIQNGEGLIVPTVPQGPIILPNGPILGFASLGTDTTPVVGTLYRCEIYVPYLAKWTGIGILNGSVAATDAATVSLYDSNGVGITRSAIPGDVATGVNAFQQRAFINAVTIAPGRYFIGVQFNGTTTRFRTWAAANGGNQMTSSATGIYGNIPPSFTPPTTFTANVGPIAYLYQ
jgi:hypothetical protein